jgi:hypothetical protein
MLKRGLAASGAASARIEESRSNLVLAAVSR